MSVKYVRIRFSRWLYLTIGSACLVFFALLWLIYSYLIVQPVRHCAMEVIIPESKPKLFLPKKETWLLNWQCLDCGEELRSKGKFTCELNYQPEPIDSFEMNAIHPVLHIHRQNDKLYYYAYNWQGGYKYDHPLLATDEWQFHPRLPQINLKPCDWNMCQAPKLDKLLDDFRRYALPDSNYLVTFSFGEDSTYGDFVESMDWMIILKTKRCYPRDLTEIEKNSLPIRGI